LARLPAIIAFDENVAVLRCWGDEDRGTQGRRRHAITRALRCRADVEVDLGELDFADTSLMLDLLMLARRLRRRGRELHLTRPQPHIARLIQIVGLHRLDGVTVEEPPPRGIELAPA
jgi:anti-anti-sigma factor